MILNPSRTSQKYEDLRQTGRKFSTIHLSGELSFHLVWQFLKQSDIAFLSAVTEMTIGRTTLQLIDFNNLLKMFPNLERLELFFVKLPSSFESGEQLDDQDKPMFKKLKNLFFSYETDSRLLQCFTNAKLRILNCREQLFTRSTIWKFLLTQNELKEIDFCRTASNATFEFGIDQPLTFTLKKIALDYKALSDFNGIMELALLQPNQFETVELGHIPDLSVYAIIFSNLKNLKTLHLMPGSVGMNLSNGLQLQPLRSVTSLRLYDGVHYGFHLTSIEDMTIKVIQNLPNLENLELFMPYKQIYYQSIVENLKKLKSLTIRVTFDTKLKNLKYPPVQRLRIICFKITGKYNCAMHQPISMVTDGEEVVTHETIRSFTYGGDPNEEFFGFVRKTFPMLELLEVRKDLAKFENARSSGIRQIHFRDHDFFTQVRRF